MNPKNYPPRTRTTKSIIIIFTLVLIPLAIVILYPNKSRIQAISATQFGGGSSRLSGRFFSPSASTKPDFRLLIGVITRPELHERRHIVRQAYALQQSSLRTAARIDVRFVFCNLTTEEQHVLVSMEILLYNDIIVLNCSENINEGKTYTYFSSLPNLFDGRDGWPYDFVIKTDDDAFFQLDNLAEVLRKLPREDVYLGNIIPCEGYTAATFRFSAGFGYMLSWDLVEWIATSEIPKRNPVGLEDMLLAEWLRDGKRGKNTFDMNPRMYDFLEGSPEDCYRREFVPETIAVHKLKDNLKWAKTIKYFNLTQGLKPSKFYHPA